MQACGRSSSSTRSTAPTPGPPRCSTSVFDLFVELDADDATLDFPTIYASGRQGIATHRPGRARQRPAARCSTRSSSTCRRPRSSRTRRCRCWSITLDYSDYVGRIGIGRVVAGKIRKGQRIALLKRDGQPHRRHGRAALRLRPPGPHRDRRGRAPATSAPSSAWTSVDIGDTIADLENPVALPPITGR